MARQPEPRWFKSTYSGGSGTECVECAPVLNGTAVRDSKRPNGGRLNVGGAAWSDFIGAVRTDQLT
ncbi:DUF397 domain-containing protein [Streptomyces sp. NBC_01387]|uniref:DUF397 domain-containing protein n=1 Tax=unclassified Streptomyces TaxID=2593676 RepID=UPI00225A06B4|nr:DUF397 domain-containing protein [Streptomyces sp. NBC_01500]MCX4550897.1 DUF397 domain-containing protein [Streptomyces sp. NBC_01500]WSV56166.1 DUF397 domain-containing protein [Streptomyces sp. NBC_01014]